MTTHEAMALKALTNVEWLPPEGHLAINPRGTASPAADHRIRIIWQDQSEADSLIRMQDRRSLASIKIIEDPQPYLKKKLPSQASHILGLISRQLFIKSSLIRLQLVGDYKPS